VALFPWKKSGNADKGTPKPGSGAGGLGAGGGKSNGTGGDGQNGEGDPGGGDGQFQAQPEKARKWFDYARNAADTSNFDYALTCYANGIKFDPEAMSAHEAMYEAAIKHLNKSGGPASGKDLRGLDDGTPVGKFAAAEFAWMKDIINAPLAIKTLENAIKAGQNQYGNWVASRVFNLILKQKKVSKNHLVQAAEMFQKVNAFNEAIAAMQKAKELDPSDNALEHALKDLSAQRAMDQGGYEKAAGQEGGFRAFVKNSEQQRELQESDAIVTSESVEQRNLLRAKEAYEKSTGTPDVLHAYGQLLKKKGTAESEQLAYQVYLRGFQETGEYRFRMFAGDIKIEQLRRDVEKLQQMAVANPTDASIKPQLETTQRMLLELESAEFNERVQRYSTDRPLKMRLGEIEYALKNYESAIAQLQQAKDEPRLRVRAGHALGRCYEAEGWHREAIDEFREALSVIDVTEKERELPIRYDMMVSLMGQAKTQRSVDMAREALEICSGIARKDITYRDIRAKRKELDQIIAELAGGGPAPSP